MSGGGTAFVAWVKEGLAKPLSDPQRKALSESMAGETWEAKVSEMLKVLG